MGTHRYKSIEMWAGHIWDGLTDPYVSVTESNTRQRSKFLSSLLVIVITSLCLLMLLFVQSVATLTNPGLWLATCSVMIGMAVIAYSLSRRGHTLVAICITLSLGIPGIFIPALIVGGISGYTSLFYLLAITVNASVFLPTAGRPPRHSPSARAGRPPCGRAGARWT